MDQIESEIAHSQKVLERIRAILKEEKLAGYILLGAPGSVTFALELSPPWMKLELVDDPNFPGGPTGLRLRSKKEDYPDDPTGQQRDLEATLGFMAQTGEFLAHMSDAMLDIYEHSKQHFDVTHTESTYYPLQDKK